MSNIVNVNDADFETVVLKSELPVLVDFWAEWCGPCKAIAPTLEELADEFAGKMIIAKMDVDANQQMPVEFGVRSIPTLILFKNGQAESTQVGAMSKADLVAFLNNAI